ncbi:SnoaL-like domain-containing protein [Hymenobacter cellulosivorans]|uniref:Nuclear transport factor 2 family protein n=1 Tax=Hymenobacter cellulosivorans TaxID=2932249 RepID=A0ABY4F4M9_9BACT|nr:SnoaL-like domain-containing protein [Hymenobacter cellulosivorans]UOQ51608.1 nuclear transport factor 2 family protein [Hymenobacter cellulosivorans]
MRTIQEIADRYYALAQRGQIHQIQDELYARDAVSIEPENVSQLPITVRGIEALRDKEALLEAQIEARHGGFCGQPIVASYYFACTMGMDVTLKDRGRVQKDQVGVFEVADGHIVKEQFFYNDAVY